MRFPVAYRKSSVSISTHARTHVFWWHTAGQITRDSCFRELIETSVTSETKRNYQRETRRLSFVTSRYDQSAQSPCHIRDSSAFLPVTNLRLLLDRRETSASLRKRATEDRSDGNLRRIFVSALVAERPRRGAPDTPPGQAPPPPLGGNRIVRFEPRHAIRIPGRRRATSN